jgi:hypothetical protein
MTKTYIQLSEIYIVDARVKNSFSYACDFSSGEKQVHAIQAMILVGTSLPFDDTGTTIHDPPPLGDTPKL